MDSNEREEIIKHEEIYQPEEEEEHHTLGYNEVDIEEEGSSRKTSTVQNKVKNGKEYFNIEGGESAYSATSKPVDTGGGSSESFRFTNGEDSGDSPSGGGAILFTTERGEHDGSDILNEEDFINVDETNKVQRILSKMNYYERILNYSSQLWINSGIYKKELILTSSYLLCFIALGISVGSLGPTLVSLKENTNSTLDKVGYFFSARGAGYFFGSFSARVFDRIKHGNYLIAAAVNLMALSLFLIPLVKNIWVAGIIFAIEGYGAGIIDAGLNTMIVWVWKESVNPFMQLLHFSFGVGAFIAPLIISQLVNKTLFIQYMVLAIIMFISSLGIVFLKSAEPDLSHTDETVVASISKKEKRLRLEVLVGVAFFLFWYVGSEAGYGGWVSTYSVLSLNFSEKNSALIASLFWGSFTLFRFVGVVISLILSPQQMVILDTCICFFFSILIILFKHSAAMLWIATAGLGMGLASIFPTAFSLPQNLGMPVTGEGTSYMVIGATLGELVIPWLIGVCQHSIGPHTLPFIVLFTLVISLIIYIGINIRARYVRATDRGESFDISLATPLQLIK